MKFCPLFTVLLFTVLCTQKSFAVRIAVPQGLQGQLIFENASNQTIQVYQKIPLDPNKPFDGIWETMFPVKAQGSLYRDIETMVQPFQFESHGDLKISYRAPSGQIFPVNGALANYQEISATGRGVQRLFITNYSSQAQTVEVQTKTMTGRRGNKKSIALAPFAMTELDVQVTYGIKFQISGEYPVGAFLQAGEQVQFATPKPRKLQKTDQAGRLFLLANEARTQSYIVRLTDPALIQSAQEQIQNPTGWRARILVGEVSAGSNRDNQNLLSPLAPMWSWHISKVYRFSELASQSCDGHPQFIEDVLPAWVGGSFNGGSTVTCFWGYRIIQEL